MVGHYLTQICILYYYFDIQLCPKADSRLVPPKVGFGILLTLPLLFLYELCLIFGLDENNIGSQMHSPLRVKAISIKGTHCWNMYPRLTG